MSADFLTVVDVLAIHASRIALYGGAPGVRDPGGLESAVAMPQASFDGQLMHPTLHEQAAAYLFHLARNHPFVDGNKRAALAAALVFLGLNGSWVAATEPQLVELTTSIAAGARSKADAAVFFEKHGRRWRPTPRP